MIRVGTAGFRFADWKGRFYPQGLADKNMLDYYARHFNLLELDYTYYTMPFARTLASLAAKVPDDFVFCVKANRLMTHDIPDDPKELKSVFDRFNDALTPLCEQQKLGCVLVQFPWAFRREPKAIDYLKRVSELMGDRESVIEFRHSDWVCQDSFDLLKRLGLGYCCVDEPRIKTLMPPVAVATSRLGYVRFHGRNAATWWKHDNPSLRYDYLYDEHELNEWATDIERLKKHTDRVFVLFNNCHEAKAAHNARDMTKILGLPEPNLSDTYYVRQELI